MINFRDLGGIKTQDGRVVKKNLFYRSGSLENLSEEDIADMKKLKIRTVMDFRSDEEAKKHPTTMIEGIKDIRISAMSLEGFGNSKFGSVEEMIEKMFNNNGVYNILKEGYYDLPVNNKAYKELVDIVKNKDRLPVLNHCSAGKDRTGVGSAIILMILGVSRENIYADYMKSNDFAQGEVDRFVKYKPEFKDVDREKLNHVFGVNEDYIGAAFKRIDDDYVSVEDYLFVEFGLDRAQLSKLRNQYLE
ncbi:MAG: tyrosine-protein phosphatase [Clostridioides sp.]|jgi:protein-tyrosine phosphatase|nr:tyrosine-protein phosphatase [Clostridioides sp.]